MAEMFPVPPAICGGMLCGDIATHRVMRSNGQHYGDYCYKHANEECAGLCGAEAADAALLRMRAAFQEKSDAR
jgi:hypothetical protein